MSSSTRMWVADTWLSVELMQLQARVFGKRSDQAQHNRVTPAVPPLALGKDRRWRHWVCRSYSSKLQTLFHKETIPTGFTVQKESNLRAYKLLSVPLAIKSHPQSLIKKLSSFSGNNTSFFLFTLFYTPCFPHTGFAARAASQSLLRYCDLLIILNRMGYFKFVGCFIWKISFWVKAFKLHSCCLLQGKGGY